MIGKKCRSCVRILDMEYYVSDTALYIAIKSLYYDTIQDFFDTLIPSKKIQHLLIQNKWIRIDEESVKRESALKGDTLAIDLYPFAHDYPILKDDPSIVYEDELFLIANKPNGMLVHSDGKEVITLEDLVGSYLAKHHLPGENKSIQRLDVETSGLVIFSKSPIFKPLLDQYLIAVCENKADFKELVINKNIGSDRHDKNKMVIAKRGKEAKTLVKTLYSDDEYSVFKCELRTGRTHQIRVHLASIGHPIINDELYGRPSKLLKRMGLCAYETEFYHPLKEEMVKVRLKLDSDFRELLKYGEEY